MYFNDKMVDGIDENDAKQVYRMFAEFLCGIFGLDIDKEFGVEKKGPHYLVKMIAKNQARDYSFGGILKNTEYCKNLLVLSNKRN